MAADDEPAEAPSTENGSSGRFHYEYSIDLDDDPQLDAATDTKDASVVDDGNAVDNTIDGLIDDGDSEEDDDEIMALTQQHLFDDNGDADDDDDAEVNGHHPDFVTYTIDAVDDNNAAEVDDEEQRNLFEDGMADDFFEEMADAVTRELEQLETVNDDDDGEHELNDTLLPITSASPIIELMNKSKRGEGFLDDRAEEVGVIDTNNVNTTEQVGSDESALTDDDTDDRMMNEFRTLVEKLVRQVMPTEINHIDELIEEYQNREAELLDSLNRLVQDQQKTKEGETDISEEEEKEMSHYDEGQNQNETEGEIMGQYDSETMNQNDYDEDPGDAGGNNDSADTVSTYATSVHMTNSDCLDQSFGLDDTFDDDDGEGEDEGTSDMAKQWLSAYATSSVQEEEGTTAVDSDRHVVGLNLEKKETSASSLAFTDELAEAAQDAKISSKASSKENSRLYHSLHNRSEASNDDLSNQIRTLKDRLSQEQQKVAKSNKRLLKASEKAIENAMEHSAIMAKLEERITFVESDLDVAHLELSRERMASLALSADLAKSVEDNDCLSKALEEERLSFSQFDAAWTEQVRALEERLAEEEQNALELTNNHTSAVAVVESDRDAVRLDLEKEQLTSLALSADLAKAREDADILSKAVEEERLSFSQRDADRVLAIDHTPAVAKLEDRITVVESDRDANVRRLEVEKEMQQQQPHNDDDDVHIITNEADLLVKIAELESEVETVRVDNTELKSDLQTLRSENGRLKEVIIVSDEIHPKDTAPSRDPPIECYADKLVKSLGDLVGLWEQNLVDNRRRNKRSGGCSTHHHQSSTTTTDGDTASTSLPTTISTTSFLSQNDNASVVSNDVVTTPNNNNGPPTTTRRTIWPFGGSKKVDSEASDLETTRIRERDVKIDELEAIICSDIEIMKKIKNAILTMLGTKSSHSSSNTNIAIADLKEAVSNLGNDTRGVIYNLQMEVYDLESTISLQGTQHATLKQELSRLQDIIHDMESHTSYQEDEIETLKASVVKSQLKAQCLRVDERCKMDVVQEKIQDLETTNSQQEDEIESLRAEIQMLEFKSDLVEEKTRHEVRDLKTMLELSHLENSI